MLGDGMVCFGVAVVTCSLRNRKSSAKIGSRSPTRSRTRSAAGVNSIFPASLRNSTVVVLGLFDATELVDEIHVPGGAAELAVGGGPEPYLLLHPHDLPDRLVFDAAQLFR